MDDQPMTPDDESLFAGLAPADLPDLPDLPKIPGDVALPSPPPPRSAGLPDLPWELPPVDASSHQTMSASDPTPGDFQPVVPMGDTQPVVPMGDTQPLPSPVWSPWQQTSGDSTSPESPPATAVAMPTPQPTAEPTPDPTSTVVPRTPTKPPRRIGRFVVLGVGLAAIAGGAAFAYTQFTGQEKSNTPEQAIEQFYTAVSQGDAIGLAKSLAPGERDILLDSMVPMIGEMSRLGLLEDSVDLNKVKGFDGSLNNFAATSKPLRDDLAAVTITSGDLKTNINPKNLPLGKLLRDAFGEEIDEVTPSSDSTPLANTDGDPLVVQKVGKRWYLSFSHTVAESWRREDPTRQVPAKWAGVAPKGADTPEAAVADMIQAVGDLKMQRFLELVPPDEVPAMHDYAGAFLGEVNEAAAEATKYYQIKLTPQLRTEKITGDRSLVSLVDVPIEATGDIEGNTFAVSYKAKTVKASLETTDGEKSTLDLKGDCLTIMTGGETERACGQEELGELFSNITGQPVDTNELFGQGNNCLNKLPKPKLGFVTVKRDGKWFVSPTRTMLDSVTAYMRTFDRKTIDCFTDQIEKQADEVRRVFTGEADPSLDDSTFLPADEGATSPLEDPFNPEDTFGTLPEDFPIDTIPSDTTIVFDTIPFDEIPEDTSPESAATSTVPEVDFS
jgi:hypothetical protein